MEIKSGVIARSHSPGVAVSYGSLWQAEAETRIVTIPCGYADGYFRRMTNHAQVIVNGKKYPQVGRICMDQFMVNVGDDEVKWGMRLFCLGTGIPPKTWLIGQVQMNMKS